MKDFFQYRGSLTEARKARSKSAKIKYLEWTFDAVKSDFVKAGRNSTDVSIDHEPVKDYVTWKDKLTPVIDWKKMAKEDPFLLDYIHDEFWLHYGA